MKNTFTPFGDLTKFHRSFIGMDSIVKHMTDLAEVATKAVTNFPPYNIKKIDENKYVIELAVAGFGKQDIDIEFVDSSLVIKGNASADENSDYLYKGISERAFTRQFSLADNIEVKNADLVNGMLKVWLEALIPESRGKKITIGDNSPEFLTEENK